MTIIEKNDIAIPVPCATPVSPVIYIGPTISQIGRDKTIKPQNKIKDVLAPRFIFTSRF
jgi:hypothetical protein